MHTGRRNQGDAPWTTPWTTPRTTPRMTPRTEDDAPTKAKTAQPGHHKEDAPRTMHQGRSPLPLPRISRGEEWFFFVLLIN